MIPRISSNRAAIDHRVIPPPSLSQIQRRSARVLRIAQAIANAAVQLVEEGTAHGLEPQRLATTGFKSPTRSGKEFGQ